MSQTSPFSFDGFFPLFRRGVEMCTIESFQWLGFKNRRENFQGSTAHRLLHSVGERRMFSDVSCAPSSRIVMENVIQGFKGNAVKGRAGSPVPARDFLHLSSGLFSWLTE